MVVEENSQKRTQVLPTLPFQLPMMNTSPGIPFQNVSSSSVATPLNTLTASGADLTHIFPPRTITNTAMSTQSVPLLSSANHLINQEKISYNVQQQNYNNLHFKLAKVVTLSENSGQFVTLL